MACVRGSSGLVAVAFVLLQFSAEASNNHPLFARWYILTPNDFPEEHRDHATVQAIGRRLEQVSKEGMNCLGPTGPAEEFYYSNDLSWSCMVLHKLMTSPLRTYNFDQADFVVVPEPPPADLEYDKSDPNYFKDAEWLFPRRKEKPHVLLMRWNIPKQIPGIENAPEVAKSFFFLIQQYPAYFIHGYDSWFDEREWQYKPEEHPAVTAMKYQFVGAPWIAMTKWTYGSKYFHIPLDIEKLKEQKSIPLKGWYQVRTPQRRWIHEQCNKEEFCQSEDIWAYEEGDPRRMDFIGPYKPAWVAIQPQGDEPTRTAMFDVWCHNAVNLFLAEPEWILPYFPFTDIIDYRKIAYFVSHVDKARAENREHYLREFWEQYSLDKTVDMVRTAHNITRVFQYMQEPHHFAIRMDLLQEMHKYEDAFTFTIKALLRRLCNLGHINKQRCGGKWFKPLHDGIVGLEHIHEHHRDV